VKKLDMGLLRHGAPQQVLDNLGYLNALKLGLFG
jgi:hypothetical protein